jgi:hypothetical protein
MRAEQTKRMPGAGLLAAALASSLALSGCSLVGDGQQVWDILQGEAAQQGLLEEAVDELRELPAVEQAASRFLPEGPQGDEADIEVTVSAGITPSELAAVALIVHELFTGTELQSTLRHFSLEVVDGGTLTQDAFELGSRQLESELGYWAAAQDAIGAALSLELSPSSGEHPYQRHFVAVTQSDALRATDQFIANYAALQAVPDPTSAPSWWTLPGLGFQPDLPPAEVVGLLKSVRDTAPLIDQTDAPESPPADYEYPEGAQVGWFPMGPERKAAAWVNVYQNEYRAADWSSVLQVAELAAHAGTLFAYNGGERQFRFYPDECTGTIDVTADDRMLVDALVLQGVVLPAGGGAGFCMPSSAG